MRDGTFPRSRLLANRKVAWVESEVADWINNRPTVRLKGDAASSK
jgi:predicted DNA-binding transcriptional regulator AlpA